MITLTNAAHINSATLVELLTAIDRLHHNAAITLHPKNRSWSAWKPFVLSPSDVAQECPVEA